MTRAGLPHAGLRSSGLSRLSRAGLAHRRAARGGRTGLRRRRSSGGRFFYCRRGSGLRCCPNRSFGSSCLVRAFATSECRGDGRETAESTHITHDSLLRYGGPACVLRSGARDPHRNGPIVQLAFGSRSTAQLGNNAQGVSCLAETPCPSGFSPGLASPCRTLELQAARFGRYRLGWLRDSRSPSSRCSSFRS